MIIIIGMSGCSLHFAAHLGFNKPDDVILQIKREERLGHRSSESWSAATPEAYSILLSTSDDRVNLWVSAPNRLGYTSTGSYRSYAKNYYD
jgi:hypothetical protein